MGKPKNSSMNDKPPLNATQKLKSNQRSSSLNRININSLKNSKTIAKNSSSRESRTTGNTENTEDSNNINLDSFNSDSTDSVSSNDKQEKFRNNSSSKHPQVRSYYSKINKDDYQCNECGAEVKTNNSSDANLRTHMARKHERNDLLLPSQMKKPTAKVGAEISTEEKNLLHRAVVDCILTDTRPFNDFNKAGIKVFLQKIRPAYKAPSRHWVRKCITKK